MLGRSLSRVVVTGYGVHAAIEQLDDAFELQRRGETRVDWQEVSNDSGALRCVGAKCSREPPFAYLTQRKWLKYMGLETQYSVWAAGKALQHAGLSGAASGIQAVRESMALFLATGPIAFEVKDLLPGVLASRGPNAELDLALAGVAGLRNSPPMMPFHTLRNMPIGLISMAFGIKGHNAIYYPDAEQSLFAFSAAVRAIESGRVSSALVGGTANLLSMMPIVTYRRRGFLAEAPANAVPFGAEHRGWALGDASAMVVLESESHARARDAHVYGVLDVESTALSTDELIESKAVDARQADLTLVTGTRNLEQDADASRISSKRPRLSLDALTGYTGAASPALNLAAACHLLECPTLFEDGSWGQRGSIDVLSAHTVGLGQEWGRLRLEAAS